jgi:tRNA G46 methylase TrmB
LAATVRRHLAAGSRKPVATHNIAAFKLLLAALAHKPRPLVLDSFCGTGHSTAALARRHPGHLVVGIDKSGYRLDRHPDNPSGQYLLLQAECEDLWRLLAQERIGVDHHYLLYPNPWPKAKHLQRRVHGGNGFYWLLQLAAPEATTPSRIELRSNWQTYVEEFGVAMHLAGFAGAVARVPPDPASLSLFEQKYRASGHDLWAYTGAISPAPAARAGQRPGGAP